MFRVKLNLVALMILVLVGSVSAANLPATNSRNLLRFMGAKGLKGAAPRQLEDCRYTFNLLDTDKDKKLSKGEFIESGLYSTKQVRTGIFNNFDLDKDGLIDEKEYADGMIITEEAKKTFDKLDKNTNNKVTKEEFITNSGIRGKKRCDIIFKILDTNLSGDLGLVEFLKVWNDLSQKAKKGLNHKKLRRPAGGKTQLPGVVVRVQKPGKGRKISLGKGAVSRPRQNRAIHNRPDDPLSVQGPPLGKTREEKKILKILASIHDRRRMLNVPREDGRLLRVLAESTGAKRVVEIGTSNGYSGIWMCLALRKTGGKLTTYEIDAKRAELAGKNFKRAGVEDLVTIVVGDAHDEVSKQEGPIDMLFIDADKPGYLDYLDKLLPKVRPGGLIVSHNMRYPKPDPKYINKITKTPGLETLFLNMYSAGIGVTLKKY